MNQKFSGIKKFGGGGYHVSLSKNFCLTVPIKFEEPFCVSKEFWYRKFSNKGGGASRFCQNTFYLTGPKKLRQGTILCFRKLLVGKNILWIRGGGGVSRFSVEKFLSDSQNISLENCLVFQKNSLIENFHSWGGGHHGFVEIFCLTGPKRKSL